ncbi:ankycorbin isoform X3 [Amia ocellicauda]|uniref:ankycorbin isoform X3 n=1 Tax=Amia ocellicauda TaxID=2972642 RepID=UPI003464D701
MKSLKAKFRKSDGHEWNKNDDRLLGAVEHGETDKVTSLLAKKGVNAVKLDSEGKSALHLAAAKGQAECLGLILAHGADASVLDASGSSALHLAAKNNHQECAKKLIQQSKCAIEALDNTGKTALHHTAVIGSVQFIRLLCEHKCPVNVKDVDGNTPLLLSARHAQADACRSLVEHGADINACDKNGRTAVMLASESSSVPTVQVLIEKGADLTLTDSLGHDVLHYAKLSGNPEVKSLLQVTLGTEKTTPKQIQHDQVTKLNEERSTTPKKRKAPPPPLSPPQNYQSSDFSSPPYMTPTQTPLSTKDDSFMEFSLKGDELKSIALKEEIEKLVEERNTLVDTIQDLKQLLKHTQPDMAHNGNEEESVIITLQAKIASLSLENQQLAQILKRSAHQTEEDSLRFGRDESRPNSFDSNASFHSTKADFDQSTDSHDVLAQESEESVLEESTLDTSNASVRQKEGEKESEEEVKLLRDALQSLQIKLQESQLENQSLQAKLLPAGSADALQPSSEDLVENVSELKEKIKETQCKYEEAMQQVLALKAERCLEPVASDENNTIPNLQGLQVMYEDEIKDLKEKLSRALEEQERDANLIKQLESKLETMDNRVSAEQCEEMKQSYSMLVDNINQEKALLIDKYKEAQEDIKMLQEALKGTVPVEAAAKDFEEMKAEMGQTIDGLQRRLLELSHSYSEAKSELSAARNSLSTSPLEEQRLKEYVTKEHHDQVTQDFARRIEEMKEGITETDARYREALKEIVLLKEEAESQKQSSVTISDHMQVVSSLGSAIKELEAQVGKLKEELSQKMLEVDSLKQQLSAEKSTLREDSIPRRAHEELKDALESEIRQLTVNLQQALRKQDELSLEVAQAWQEVKEVKNEKQTIQGIATSKDQENNELQARYKEAKELVSHLKKQVESFSDIEEDKDKKIEDLTKEVSKLKDALNSLSQLSYTTGTPKRQNQQVDSLQQQVKQLQFQLSESKKQHQEIVSVYRMHLLYAVQGQMDEDVQKALKQILMMCKMPSQAK